MTIRSGLFSGGVVGYVGGGVVDDGGVAGGYVVDGGVVDDGVSGFTGAVVVSGESEGFICNFRAGFGDLSLEESEDWGSDIFTITHDTKKREIMMHKAINVKIRDRFIYHHHLDSWLYSIASMKSSQ